MAPGLSVIVVSWNTREVLRGCLESLRAHLADEHETIVVDNASSDGSPEMVAADFPEARLVRHDRNLGFGRGANAGMAAARGADLLLLNSDCYWIDGSFPALRRALHEAPDVGLAGPRIVLPDGRLQASARRFPSLGRLLLSELWLHRLMSRDAAAERLLGHYWAHERPREADWLVGACLLLRREVFEQTEGFDPRIFMYGEEVEWCRRVRARGWRIVFTPAARVLHLDHKSADRLFGDDGRTDRCLLAEHQLLRQWHGPLAAWCAEGVRASGALLRLLLFWPRRDPYGRDVVAGARATLAHYGRRLRGATWKPAA